MLNVQIAEINLTICVGARFGDRICIVSDTMISSRDWVRDDIVPGQLKAIVLSMKFSLAYAGLVHVGIRTARVCAAQLRNGATFNDILSILRTASADGRCDFLIASHENGAQLFKIANGRVSDDQDFHWIGDSSIVSRMKRQAEETEAAFAQTLLKNPHLDDVRTEESKFLSSFLLVLLTSPRLSAEVGGVPINLLGSPNGHCYGNHAGAFSPGPISIGGPPHPETAAPGGDRYACSVTGAFHRGVAINSVFFDEAAVGYIYNPLEWDEPRKMAGTTLERINDELRALGAAAGGVPEADI